MALHFNLTTLLFRFENTPPFLALYNHINAKPELITTQVLSSHASNNQVKAAPYYPKLQQGIVAPTIGQVVITMSSVRTVGAYRIFQAFIVQPGAVSAGENFIDIKVGTVSTSAKMSTTLFGLCTNTGAPISC